MRATLMLNAEICALEKKLHEAASRQLTEVTRLKGEAERWRQKGHGDYAAQIDEHYKHTLLNTADIVDAWVALRGER